MFLTTARNIYQFWNPPRKDLCNWLGEKKKRGLTLSQIKRTRKIEALPICCCSRCIRTKRSKRWRQRTRRHCSAFHSQARGRRARSSWHRCRQAIGLGQPRNFLRALRLGRLSRRLWVLKSVGKKPRGIPRRLLRLHRRFIDGYFKIIIIITFHRVD